MIIMMGVAGVGKSLQGKRLADNLGLPWLSTGEFLRMLVVGQRRKDMLAGKLLDDNEMIHLADKIFHMIDTSEEFILDGFPRTVGQAEWLIAQHKAGLIEVSHILHLEASEQVVRDRLLARGRQDDTAESITQRFQEYQKTTVPIIQDFEQHGIEVHHINGEGSVDEIQKQIQAVCE